jgi:hypothetical protein
MNKSIETIWQEGFLQNDALLAPKINDLYNQKSIHIIDRLKGMFKVNLQAIVIGASGLLIVSFFLGVPFVGAFIFLLLLGLAYYGHRESNRMREIDQTGSSYDYLKAFDSWLKEVIAGYTRIYRFFYPAFFLAIFTGIWLIAGDKIMDKLLTKFPDTYLIGDVPVFLLLGAIVFAGLTGVFAGVIYRLDMNIIYGNVFAKLDEIIADMEELRV